MVHLTGFSATGLTVRAQTYYALSTRGGMRPAFSRWKIVCSVGFSHAAAAPRATSARRVSVCGAAVTLTLTGIRVCGVVMYRVRDGQEGVAGCRFVRKATCVVHGRLRGLRVSQMTERAWNRYIRGSRVLFKKGAALS